LPLFATFNVLNGKKFYANFIANNLNHFQGHKAVEIAIAFQLGVFNCHLAFGIPIDAAKPQKCHLNLARLAGYSAHHPVGWAKFKPR
jgi:hypothetical protein